MLDTFADVMAPTMPYNEYLEMFHLEDSKETRAEYLEDPKSYADYSQFDRKSGSTGAGIALIVISVMIVATVIVASVLIAKLIKPSAKTPALGKKTSVGKK